MTLEYLAISWNTFLFFRYNRNIPSPPSRFFRQPVSAFRPSAWTPPESSVRPPAPRPSARSASTAPATDASRDASRDTWFHPVRTCQRSGSLFCSRWKMELHKSSLGYWCGMRSLCHRHDVLPRLVQVAFGQGDLGGLAQLGNTQTLDLLQSWLDSTCGGSMQTLAWRCRQNRGLAAHIHFI